MDVRRMFFLGFALCVAAITYFDIKKCHHLPWPPRLIFTGLVFALLDIFSFFNEELAGVTAIGFTIAIFVKQGWIADCEMQGGTGQPQTTTFIGNVYAQQQPPSYGLFQQPTGAFGGQPQQPGTTLT